LPGVAKKFVGREFFLTTDDADGTDGKQNEKTGIADGPPSRSFGVASTPATTEGINADYADGRRNRETRITPIATNFGRVELVV